MAYHTHTHTKTEDERGLVFREKPGVTEVKENMFLVKLCPLSVKFSPVVLKRVKSIMQTADRHQRGRAKRLERHINK